MEPTKVIEEIAEQLGMAVGEAAKFIESILPQYAGLQAMENGIIAVFTLAVFVACVVVVLKSIAAIVELKNQKLSHYEYSGKSDSFWTAITVACPIGFIALLFAVLCGIDALGWALFPDAKLLVMAVKAVM